MMMKPIDQETAFVTGGGSGIGRALAKELAARDTIVCVTDIDADAARAVALECGPAATSQTLDVRDAAAVKSSVEAFAAKYGRLDKIFNNAGIAIAGDADSIALEGWRHITDINIFGVLHGVLAAYPIMLKQGYGHIVNTASLAGLGPARSSRPMP